MKILHVIRDLSPATGGPVTALNELARAQAEEGHDVVVAATDFGIDTTPSIAGVEVCVFPCTSTAWRWSREMEHSLPALLQRADIVHIHTLWEYPTWAAARFCRKLGRPYIIRPCGMLDAWSMSQRGLKKKLYLKMLLGTAFLNASALHFTSEGELTKSVPVACSGNRFVVPIGISLASGKVATGSLRKRFPDLIGKSLILFLGRIHYKKQPDLLIRAFSAISGRFPDARLVLAGPADSEYRKELQCLADDLGLQGRVVWTGFLDREQAADAYRSTDLFVLPSLQENFGISVAEAMAAGCPVIVSENVDLAVDIVAESAGLVCPNDVNMLAAGMSRLLESPGERLSMGENGLRLVQRRFSPEVVTHDVLEIYEDILSGRTLSTNWRGRPE